jgi:putative heme-binding domain-containing protein
MLSKVTKSFCIVLLLLSALASAFPLYGAQDESAGDVYDKENLVAWCIVPFDAKKRLPEERAAMLDRLGFKHFAYDWRAEHLPSFEREVQALKRHRIELTAVWFPAALNKDAQQLLDVFAKHQILTQLWVSLNDPAPQADQATKIKQAAKLLRPIALAADKLGCSLGLYNHGGWFGQPENQIAIIQELKLPNVGVVYNLHHGHEHLDRLPELLKLMRPYLFAINLNGMAPAGDKHGQKILPLGYGSKDLIVLRLIRESGFTGRIGILGHTDDDAEARLKDNLDGLSWLVKQLEGQEAGPRPRARTPVPGLKSPAKDAQPNDRTTSQSKDDNKYPNDDKQLLELVAAAKREGDALRGMAVFQSHKFACVSCHSVGNHGGSVGPALTDVGHKLSAEQIVESLLRPRQTIKPEYVAWQITTTDGRLLQGYKQRADNENLALLEMSSGKTITLSRSDIEEEQEIGTLMPDGLLDAMTAGERTDLICFLLELGVTPGLAQQLEHSIHHPHHHQPASFTYQRAPLHPEDWPSWQHPVNRDRVYDFYTKQAQFFREQERMPALLTSFPGLDGGQQGHWGNQNEATWRDARWRETELGTVLSGVFHGPGVTVPKGVCVRLGDKGELSACFNPQTLQYAAVWRGGFIKLSDVRHGFLDGLQPDGTLIPLPTDKVPPQPFTYHGFFRHGKRVVFAYRLGDMEILDVPWAEAGQFHRIVAPRDQHPLRHVLQGGPAQWPQEFRVRGTLGSNEPYAVDTIPLPFENLWKAPLFLGDHDFLSDGSAMVCTMQGDVWHVSGLDEQLENVRWRRFASGLHQPLGLVIHDDQIYVLGRDQITRLHDLNGDGEADYYECFSNAIFTSPGGHDYITGLARDAAGRFYAACSKKGLIRVSADGKRVETLATGFRTPDGLGLLPDGAITVPCSEGDWTPASMICLVRPPPIASSGVPAAPLHFGYGGPRGNQPPALPLVYLPRGLDNSSGGQLTVPDGRWGPLAGQLLHFSFGTGSHFLVLRDEVQGQPQGAIVPLVGEFRSGAHRGKFNPKDGQLYVSGMAGWGTYTPDDGCFHRVRYTGMRVQLPKAFHVHENGVLVTFTAPVDPKVVGDATNHFAQVWNYRYGPGYGSPEFSTRHQGVEGHDVLAIKAAHVVDEHTVFVQLPELQPVNQLHLYLEVDSGRPQELFITVHRLDKPFTQIPDFRPVEKTIAAHPQLIDLASLRKSEPNPWRTKLPQAQRLEVTAGENLSFSPRLLKARRGEAIELVFTNPDEAPHNWVLVEQNALSRVGDLANKLIANPEAVLRHYVPDTADVLAYTDVVPSGKLFRIYFTAPAEPGRYPFLCTFPGHWMVMNGQLVVE